MPIEHICGIFYPLVSHITMATPFHSVLKYVKMWKDPIFKDIRSILLKLDTVMMSGMLFTSEHANDATMILTAP